MKKELSKFYWKWFVLPNDKKAHFGLGKDIAWVTFSLQLLLALFVSKWFLLIPPVFASAVAGVAKESYDKYVKKGKFDSLDAWWTVYGGVPITVYHYIYAIIQQLLFIFL